MAGRGYQAKCEHANELYPYICLHCMRLCCEMCEPSHRKKPHELLSVFEHAEDIVPYLHAHELSCEAILREASSLQPQIDSTREYVEDGITTCLKEQRLLLKVRDTIRGCLKKAEQLTTEIGGAKAKLQEESSKQHQPTASAVSLAREQIQRIKVMYQEYRDLFGGFQQAMDTVDAKVPQEIDPSNIERDLRREKARCAELLSKAQKLKARVQELEQSNVQQAQEGTSPKHKEKSSKSAPQPPEVPKITFPCVCKKQFTPFPQTSMVVNIGIESNLIRCYNIKERYLTTGKIANRMLPYNFDMAILENGDIYISGGSYASYEDSRTLFLVKQIQDENSELFYHLLLKADMLEPRAQHTLIARHSSTLYAIGGLFTGIQTTEWYDIKNDKWSAGPELNYPRTASTACVYDGTILFVFGGKFSNMFDESLIEYLYCDEAQISDSHWSLLELKRPCKEWHPTQYAGSAQISGNEIMIFGGYVDKDTPENQCFILNVDNRELQLMDESLPYPEYFKKSKYVWYNGTLAIPYRFGIFVYLPFLHILPQNPQGSHICCVIVRHVSEGRLGQPCIRAFVGNGLYVRTFGEVNTDSIHLLPPFHHAIALLLAY